MRDPLAQEVDILGVIYMSLSEPDFQTPSDLLQPKQDANRLAELGDGWLSHKGVK